MKFIKENLRYIVIVLLIILFTVSIVPKTFQNDTFYTIAIGKQIIEHGLDDVEHFAWHEDLKYQTPHWGFDYINGLIYNVFGLEGLYTLVCAISVILMLIIYFNMVNKGINWVIAYISTMVTAYLLRDLVFTDRAQILSYLLFFIEVILIEDFLKYKSKLDAIALFILAVLIANIHAGAWPMFFILFLPYIGEYIFQKLSIRESVIKRIKKEKKELEKLQNSEGPSQEIEKIRVAIERDEKFINEQDAIEPRKIISKKNDNVKWLIVIMILCVFSALITPRPNVPFTYFLKIAAGETTSYISEHMPLIVAGNLPFLVIMILAIALLTFTDTKIRLTHAFLLLGLTLMSLISIRHVTFLVLFGSYIITKLIDDFIKKYGHEDIEENLKRKIKNIFFILLCIVVLALTIYFFVENSNYEFVEESLYPVEATDWMLNNLDVNRIKLYNGYNYGSYLLYRGVPVFMDSRSDLYTPQFNKGSDIFGDYIDISHGKKTFREVFEEYDITHALVEKDSLEDVYMGEDGLCNNLYEDEYFVLYQYNGNIIK